VGFAAPCYPVALVRDDDIVRLGVALCSTSTATVLYLPSSTRMISELVTQSR